jgi:hypothetical protein
MPDLSSRVEVLTDTLGAEPFQRTSPERAARMYSLGECSGGHNLCVIHARGFV